MGGEGKIKTLFFASWRAQASGAKRHIIEKYGRKEEIFLKKVGHASASNEITGGASAPHRLLLPPGSEEQKKKNLFFFSETGGNSLISGSSLPKGSGT